MSRWTDLLAGLDPDSQLPAVTDPRNTVVSAGAGSGKTRVLAVRYLYLVRERGVSPERILCLTFTNKAAAEMRERIRGMMRDCAVDDPAFAAALEILPASRISTLDSFCAELARAGCARWGVSPDFSPDQDEAADATADFALEFLLKRRRGAGAAGDPAVAAYLEANGYARALDGLLSLAAGRDGLLGLDPARIDPERQDRAIEDVIGAQREALVDLLAPGLDLDPGGGSGGAAWLAAASAFMDAEPGSAAPCEVLRGLRKPTGGAEGPRYFHEVADEVKARAGAVALAMRALADERRRPVLGMLHDFAVEAAARRAASGVLSYADVAAMALGTLRSDPELLDWYRSRFDAIMVDEFQDDNSLQKDLLYLLAGRRGATRGDDRGTVGPELTPVPVPEDLEAGRLFFVGDEKQSIYRFRNADVTVFRGLSLELERTPGGLGHHALDRNWRSEPGLVDFFNGTFSRVMPGPDADARDYEARFAGLLAGPATPGVMAEAAWFEYDPPADDEAPAGSTASPGRLSFAEAQAWRIAELVRSLVDDGVPVTAKVNGHKTARPCRYEDIAILLRSTPGQNVIERYFRLFGIPYTATASAGVLAESVLGDLYAMLRLAVYPDDRLAWATVLRGPFARLSDASVARVLESDERDAFAFDPDSLPDGDRAHYEAARATFEGVRRMADRDGLAVLVTWLWYDRGLRWNVLRTPGNAEFLEHFDFAWSMAADADARGLRLVDFVAGLEERIGRVERLDDLPVVREGARGVAIMSVHASKGLEFPVVILPFIENAGRNDIPAAVRHSAMFGWSALVSGPDGSPSDPVTELRKAVDGLGRAAGSTDTSEPDAETLRLFYVACTRAASRLYLFGRKPGRTSAPGKSFRGLLLRAWPGLDPGRFESGVTEAPGESATGRPRFETITPRTVEEYGRLARTVHGGARGDRPQAMVRTAAATTRGVPARRARLAVTAAAAALHDLRTAVEVPADETGTKHRGDGRTGGMSEADFGTLAHEFVEARLRNPERRPEPSPRMATVLAHFGDRNALQARALAMADRFLGTELGRQAAVARDRAARVRPPGDRATPAIFETEYAFVHRLDTRDGPVYLTGAMDLVFGDRSGLTVVDFKTDARPEPGRHDFQLGLYREAAEALFGATARALIHYLAAGRTEEVTARPDADALAAALAGC